MYTILSLSSLCIDPVVAHSHVLTPWCCRPLAGPTSGVPTPAIHSSTPRYTSSPQAIHRFAALHRGTLALHRGTLALHRGTLALLRYTRAIRELYESYARAVRELSSCSTRAMRERYTAMLEPGPPRPTGTRARHERPTPRHIEPRARHREPRGYTHSTKRTPARGAGSRRGSNPPRS